MRLGSGGYRRVVGHALSLQGLRRGHCWPCWLKSTSRCAEVKQSRVEMGHEPVVTLPQAVCSVHVACVQQAVACGTIE